MVVEILIFLWKKCVYFSAPLSHSVRRRDMDAWVPPGNSYESYVDETGSRLDTRLNEHKKLKKLEK